jgi:cytochrome c oxidase subunit 2
MLLRVVAESPEDFEKWIARQKLHAVSAAQAEVFLSLSCINCHTVSGTAATGKFGPDLTHLMSRKTLASGAIPNDPDHLRNWIKDPQQIKPGNLMPDMQLSEKELDRVVAYLSSLQ